MGQPTDRTALTDGEYDSSHRIHLAMDDPSPRVGSAGDKGKNTAVLRSATGKPLVIDYARSLAVSGRGLNPRSHVALVIAVARACCVLCS